MKDREAEDQDEAVAATSLLTEDGEPVTCLPEDCLGKFNLLKLHCTLHTGKSLEVATQDT